jgi:ubiquinone/menaquinone biosynthesis C-methylase UbiE
MEGAIARWYARITKGDRGQRAVADAIAERLPAGGRVLEVAPGPGYLAIELARRGLHASGIDISRTFVQIANDNAQAAGVKVDFRQGNASALPYPDASFDLVVCRAAFKNFADPVGAIDEAHRVLAPGGQALIIDLRKECSRDEIDAEIDSMHLSRLSALWTRATFRWFLLKNAYTEEGMRQLCARSRFGHGELRRDGVGFELRLVKTTP